MKRCVPMANIAGVQSGPQNRLILFMRDRNIVSAALKPGNEPLKVPLVMRLITAVPWLQGVTARFVGLGVRPEHVQSQGNAK